MDSRPPTSDADAAPLRGTEQVAAGLHARCQPILATPRVRPLPGIGDLGRAARHFSALTFLSGTARRALDASYRGSGVGSMLVRPPDYWSGHRDDELGIARRVSTGDVALDRLVSRRAALRHQATPALRRGLPSTIHRRGYSLAGPMTAPGGMARRLQPASIVPVANPANSPQTAAARSPRSKPAARVGGREADPSRPGSRPAPALPPAPVGTVGRAEAPGRTTIARAEIVPPSATRSAPVGPPVVDGLTAASSRAPSPADAGRRSPADLSSAVGEAAARGTSSTVATGSAGSAAASGGPVAGAPVARRSPADTSAAAREAAARGTSSSTVDTGSAGSSTGSPVAGEPLARRSAAPSELDPAGPDTAPFWVTAATPAVVTRQADDGHDDPAPVWPGDLMAPDQSPTTATAVERGVGRPVAVRPLLSGWRSPTAWRSIAAGPGVRLLPVSSSAMSPAWMAARSSGASASWADQVRRAAQEDIPSSEAIRRLPVGGPTVVVRETAAAGNGARRPAPVTAASRRADEVARRSASAAESRADAAWRAAAAAVERADEVVRRSAAGSPAAASGRSGSAAGSPAAAPGRSAAAGVERADEVARRSAAAAGSPAAARGRSAAAGVERADEVARRSAAAAGSPAAASGRAASGAGSPAAASGRSASVVGSPVAAPGRSGAGSPAAALGRSGSASVVGSPVAAPGRSASASPVDGSGRSASAGVVPAGEVAPRSASASASASAGSTAPIRRAELDLAAAGGLAGPATSWSSLPVGAIRGGGPMVLLRRQVTGSGVSVSAWVPAPGSVTATPGSPSTAAAHLASPSLLASLAAPGSRAADERRPGRWLARAAGPQSTAVPTGVQRLPMGPLGPVRWSVRADEPVVARSSLGGSAWSASVAAASAAMASGVPTGDGSIRPPVSGGLTLVRGGRAGGGDLPVASVQRAGNHPAAARLRLVPPTAEVAELGAAGGRPAADGPAASRSGVARSAVAPYVGRAPMGTASFVSAPGAVAAHGLPAATASLVGVTASGAVSGRPTTPGALGRLVHGQTVVRRSVFEPAPPALVLGARPVVSAPAARSAALGLPVAPAAAARRQARALSPDASGELATATNGRSPGPASGVAPGTGATTRASAARAARSLDGATASLPTLDRAAVTGQPGPTTWAQRVARLADGAVPTPRAAASTWTTGTTTAGPSVASLRHLPVAPAAFAVVGAAAPAGRSGAPTPGTGRAPVGLGRHGGSGDDVRHHDASRDLAGGGGDRAPIVHRSRTPHGLTATVARHRNAPGATPTVAQRWQAVDVPSRALPGLAPSRLRPLLAPTTVTRATSRNAAPAAGTGRNAGSASGTGRSAASAAGTGRGRVSAVGTGRTAGSASGTGRSAASAAGTGRTAGSATDAARGAVVAPPAGAGRSADPASAAGPRADSAPAVGPGRTTAATPMVEHRPLRPDAPASAGRFEEVLRSIDQSVRPVALPVRFRPLAERIVGRLPVQIATGVASRRALASVGATAATTGSVIHLPSAPDSSARMAGILAHELTHVAAASPVARFHGGRPSVEETRANQVERIVARAARTVGTGRGPTVVGTQDLPVAGFVGPRGATSGPPVPASAQAAPAVSPGAVSADQLARRLSGGGSTPSSSGGDRTVRRTSAPAASPAVDRAGGAEDRVIRRLVAPMELDQGVEASADTAVLSEQTMDAIVQAIEARLLESIERRGGLWRGGF